MKSFTTFAATLVVVSATRARDFDLGAYDNAFYDGYSNEHVVVAPHGHLPSKPAIQSGEVYYDGQDPHVTLHDDFQPVAHHPRHAHEYHEPVVVHHVDHHYSEEDDHHDHHHHGHHDSHDSHEEYEPVRIVHDDEADYSVNHYPSELYGDVPTGDFWHQVDDFNEWEPIWEQGEYEERVQTEAELMIALEAIREALVDLDYDIDRLEDHIDQNQQAIDDNTYHIRRNDDGIDDNDHEIDDQRYRVKRLQKECRYCEARLLEDRDALVLYCQQFAFASDMVGACADILTCSGTELSYRWDMWTAAPVAHGDYH